MIRTNTSDSKLFLIRITYLALSVFILFSCTVDLHDTILEDESHEAMEEEIIEEIGCILAIWPIYSGCDFSTNEELKICMQEKLHLHIQEHFNTSICKELGRQAMPEILVNFTIDTSGNLTNIHSRSKSPHPLIEQEVERVFKLLPKMQLATQKGTPIPFSITIPIQFEN